TGRSRNDQVATDLRLWAKRELRDTALLVTRLRRTLHERAIEAEDAYLPGYTHMQRAQPVLLAHHLLAHCWALARDTDRLIATLTGLLATLKGLPLAYNRDLQEDKEPLFDSVDQVRLALVAVNGMMATAAFDTARMRAAADGGTSAATDLAEWLVSRGMP